MADTSQQFFMPVPAGNGSRQLWNANAPLGPSIVRRILITWPPGCAGLVGVQIQAGGQAAFPNVSASYMVFDNYTYAFDVQNQINSGQWLIQAFNTDFLIHNIQAIFEYDYYRGDITPGSTTPIAL